MIRHKMSHHGYRTPQDVLDRNKGLAFKKVVNNSVDRRVVPSTNDNNGTGEAIDHGEARSSDVRNTFQSGTDLKLSTSFNAVNVSTKPEYFEGGDSINRQNVLNNENVAGIISNDYHHMTYLTKRLSQNGPTHSSSSGNSVDGKGQLYGGHVVAERWFQ